MTLVSVVLTTFNGASRGFLRDAIDSVLNQADSDFELLLVDDGSADATPNVCREYAVDPRVRYIRKENGGPASARNAGIVEARGELICFLDDDDEWLPTKLARQVERFERESPRPGLVYTAIQVIDAAGHPLFVQSHQPPSDFYRGLFFENAVDCTSSVMIPKEVFHEVGDFREDIFGKSSGCEDRELWIRISRRFKVLSVDEPLVRYRLHRTNFSASHDDMERGELAMLDLAIAEARADVQAEQHEILRNVHNRFAHNRFTIGDYPAFREHFDIAGRYGRRGFSLWLRYLLSFVPFAIGPARRLLRRPGDGVLA